MSRVSAVLRPLAFLAILFLLQSVTADEGGKQVAQVKKAIRIAPPPVPGAGPVSEEPAKEEFTDALTIPTDRKAKRRLQAAEDLIVHDKAWGDAAKILQDLLESKEDLFVEVERKEKGPDGKMKTGVHRTSVRTEANRLLGTMPPEGLQFYEALSGPKAKARLAEGKSKGDPQILAEVALKYFHTEAGAEATNLLGTYRLDRGDFRMAALYFDRLLTHEKVDQLAPITLFKAILAFRRTGEPAKADQTWKRLTKKAARGIQLGDQLVSLDRLQQELDRALLNDQPANQSEWPMYGGSPNRSAQGNGSAPFLERDWYQPLHGYDKVDNSNEHADIWVKDAVSNLERRQLPVLPAMHPIAATIQKEGKSLPLVLYRSFYGIHAVNIRNGMLSWQSPSTLALDQLTQPEKKQLTSQWITQMQGGNNLNSLFENSVLGTLSTDGTYVYAVDDLGLLPHPQFMMQMQMQFGGGRPNFGAFEDALHHNKLLAFDLDSGKLIRELGGRGSSPNNPDREQTDKGELNDSFFLSAPLPLGDKLYVLSEKNGELRLVCLDPLKLDPIKNANDDNPVVWTQILATVRDKLVTDVGRRTQAAHLSYGEGILVCPTNVGAVLGIDLLTHSLIWAHSYRKAPANEANNANQMGGMGGRMMQMRMGGVMGMGGMGARQPSDTDWKVTAPIIQDGKVVYTPPDGNSLLCLNLRDGTPVWEANRVDDLYLAGVFNGKILLVGKSTCRALSLADGKQIWKLDTGMPSGQGTASDNIYYLPLKETSQGQDKGPEVCAIDIDKGKPVGHTKSRPKADDPKLEVPGNLLFYDGEVLSQTVTMVTAYPQLKAKLAQINQLLKNNPEDPVGLTERGELRLDKGDLAGAVADLRSALAHKPPSDILPKTRAKLFDSLTELFHKDFNASEQYLNEYKEMCKVTAPAGATQPEILKAEEEQHRRVANLLCLVGKGREKQGRLLEALQAYVEFGALGGNRELVNVVDEPGVKARPDVWAQGRIAALVAHATADQRKPLEDKIAEKWQTVQDTKDTQKLRDFVRVFGSLFTVGKEARLKLAERLIQEDAFLEAELHLLQLRRQEDASLAARAVETLARLMIRKGLFEDAAYYYRLLGREYAKVVVRDGKTGADFFNELATDKRFLPYLDEPPSPWIGGNKGQGSGTEKKWQTGVEVKYREIYGGVANQGPQPFALEPEGESLPYFQHHRLAMSSSPSGPQLKLIDGATGEEPWIQPLPANANTLFNNLNNPNFRFPFNHQGHLIVVNTGSVVYGLDPIGRQVLWEKPLVTAVMGQHQIMPDQDGTLQVYYPDGFMQRVGQTGPIEASYVCLHTREGLIALDPLKGTILWTKADVPAQAQVFGDDQYVYLVEVRNGQVLSGSGRALRAHDGATVPVADFADFYKDRIRVIGRTLLMATAESQGAKNLRLYDIQSGKDLWKRTFSANAIALKTQDANLAGMVEPDNEAKVTVVDLNTRREVLRTRVDPKDLGKVQQAHLLRDRDLYYLIFDQPPDQQKNPGGGPWPSVSNGLYSIVTNGKIYAFDRSTGKLRWKNDVSGQMLVLNHFQDLPMLLFTARTQKAINQGGGVGRPMMGQMVVTSIKSIVKRTGKLLYEKELPPNDNSYFYALNTKSRDGKISFVHHNLTIEHSLEASDHRTSADFNATNGKTP
jgi:outer membrane protein assembly factor BamB/tetratricopeptide (TPR) repeat protein